MVVSLLKVKSEWFGEEIDGSPDLSEEGEERCDEQASDDAKNDFEDRHFGIRSVYYLLP